MPVAMKRYLVAGGNDLRGQGGPSLHLFSDDEEGRRGTSIGESVEHRRGTLRMGPVVESESHARKAREASFDGED
jgi:hypothetical protein